MAVCLKIPIKSDNSIHFIGRLTQLRRSCCTLSRIRRIALCDRIHLPDRSINFRNSLRLIRRRNRDLLNQRCCFSNLIHNGTKRLPNSFGNFNTITSIINRSFNQRYSAPPPHCVAQDSALPQPPPTDTHPDPNPANSQYLFLDPEAPELAA